jgi:hypothetical protein
VRETAAESSQARRGGERSDIALSEIVSAALSGNSCHRENPHRCRLRSHRCKLAWWRSFPRRGRGYSSPSGMASAVSPDGVMRVWS